jgi:hypothetical protein
MVDFKKKLAAAGASWKSAKKRVSENRGSTFVDYDDGKYIAKLVKAELTESESSGRLQVDFSWRFEEEPYEGKIKHAYQGIETEDNMYYLGRDLERLGYELPDNLADLPETLEAITAEGMIARIALKSKGDFQNVYIQKVINQDEDDSDDEAIDEAAETPDDEAEETEEEATDEDEEVAAGEDEEEEEGGEEEADEEADEEEADEEAEEDEAAEDEDVVEIEVGQRVQAETAKGREPGEIIEILEDLNKVRVKLDSGKVVRLDPEKIEIEVEAAPPAPKAKTPPKAEPKAAAKKPAPAPAKKAAPAPTPAKKKKR